MMSEKIKQMLKVFFVPIFVLITILLSILSGKLQLFTHSETIILLPGIIIGSYTLVSESIRSLLKKNFALDYIAILAITVGIISGEYIAAAVIVLMMTGGSALEEFGMNKAKDALSSLKSRIPDSVFLSQNNAPDKKVKTEEVTIGQNIYIRKGEVIPLDGILVNDVAYIDQSSITGEPYEIKILKGDTVRSGTVNTGDAMILEVTRISSESTYSRIINLVKSAEEQKSPFIRLADRYSTYFTVVTLLIAGLTYFLTADLQRVLAVLVIATPCPLILATPIALMGGVSSLARHKVIVKKLAAVEIVSRIQTLIFDKTGTLTLGKPAVTEILCTEGISENTALKVAASIERSSLHPLAQALVVAAEQRNIEHDVASDIREILGKGISGVVDNKRYFLVKNHDDKGMSIVLKQDETMLASFIFSDELKSDVSEIFATLASYGLSLHILSGDKDQAVKEVVQALGQKIEYKADCSPDEKFKFIKEIKESGTVTGMVGDGVNDAPALALADVGMAFSHEENTASTEAADIVILQTGIQSILQTVTISRKTIAIALQSIIFGIALSTAGMVIASFGFIPPIYGAFIQEAIDVAVIINALRSSRIS